MEESPLGPEPTLCQLVLCLADSYFDEPVDNHEVTVDTIVGFYNITSDLKFVK